MESWQRTTLNKIKFALTALILFAVQSTFAKTLRVGLITAFTNSEMASPDEVIRSADLVKADFLKSVDRGQFDNVEFVRLDSRGTTEGGRQAFLRGYANGLRVFVGANNSDEAIAIAELAEQKKSLFVSIYATNPKVTLGRRYSYRVCFDDDLQADALVQNMLKKYVGRRIVIISNSTSIYSRELADGVRMRLRSLGAAPVSIEYNASSDTVRNAIETVVKIQPEVVFVPDNIMRASVLVKAIAKQRPKILFVGSDGFGNQRKFLSQMNGEKDVNVSYSTHWHPYLSTTQNKAFLQKYQAVNVGLTPTTAAALMYDALNVVMRAAQQAQSSDPEQLIGQLAKSTFQTTTGRLKFSKNNSPIKDVLFMSFKRGEYSLYRDSNRLKLK